MRRDDGLIAVAALAALFFLRPAAAQSVAPGSWIDATSIPQDVAPIPPEARDNPDAVPIEGGVAVLTDDAYIADRAFLFMIRCCEHRYPRDVFPLTADAACYRTFYGGAVFDQWNDHPVITGEMRAVPLPDAMCVAAGLKPGCVSTAAGAYQFIKPTWERLRRAGDFLEDFSPANQSEAALRLLEEVGARELYLAGDVEAAIVRAGRAWASLPGSKAQQNPKTMGYALDRYNEGVRLYTEALRDS